jgi:hypothetical protein
MSRRLEDFIKANRDEFDDIEPATDLWGKIEKQLPKQFGAGKSGKKTFSLGFVLRVAASIIVGMGVCFTLYLNSEKQNMVDLGAINPEYARQQVQYTSLIATKRIELKAISKSDPQLYKEFTAEIGRMDSTYKKLNHDLTTSPNQELVLRAMIRNLKMQTEVLNQQLNVIEQYNLIKSKKNETKDI